MKYSKGTALKAEYMSTLGLTPEQRANRQNGVGGSDAKDIWEGNWQKVYDRIVHNESEDLSGVFKVQLGQVTEYFNIIWNAAEYDWEVYFPKEDMCHPDFPHIRCLADAIGRDSISEFVIDGKHTMQKAPWWDEQKIVETYYWQAQHNMLVWGMGRFALTPIWGNDKGDPLWIDGNPDHQEAYLEKVNAFWWHVEHKTPPNQQDPGEEIVIALDDMRTLSMDGNNSWAELADRYREQEANAKLFESAKKEIKELVPADVKNAYGYGVQIKRNKKGSLTVTTYEGNDAA